MDDLFFQVRCGQCKGLFAVCYDDYRGQRLCCAECRLTSQREARRRHQSSPEGLADHCDHSGAYRRRLKEAGCVMDVPSQKLAPSAESLASGSGPASTEDTGLA